MSVSLTLLSVRNLLLFLDAKIQARSLRNENLSVSQSIFILVLGAHTGQASVECLCPFLLQTQFLPKAKTLNPIQGTDSTALKNSI